MSVFVDSNILLRSVQPSHPMHELAVRSVASLIEQHEALVLTPQIIAEFWNAATRPTENNGLGLSHDQTREELGRMEAFFSIVSESVEVYSEWKRLVSNYKVNRGQGPRHASRGRDARLRRPAYPHLQRRRFQALCGHH